jgi:hypothetical protein
VVFGLTAAVTASFTRALRQEGLGSILSHWEPWVLIWLGITGLLLSTGAFQASALSSSLPIIDTVEPVAGVLIGAVIFDERLATSFSGLLVQFGAAGVAAAGIALLGPALAAIQPSRQAQPERCRPDGMPAQRDLLKTRSDTTTTEDYADQLRLLPC